jgi:hypothetical protein
MKSENKVLIFCTSYCSDMNEWGKRIGSWIDQFEGSSLEFAKLLIIDDGSPILPAFERDKVEIVLGDLHEVESECDVVLYHFPDNLGRASLYNYPGWFRSFTFAAKYAKQYGYTKVIHIESDARVLSQRMESHLNGFTNGWEVYWCSFFKLPETAIQVIDGEEHLEKFLNIANQPYANFANKPADPMDHQGPSWLPYSVNKSFHGDRWTEVGKQIPDGSDYACQVQGRPKKRFF